MNRRTLLIASSMALAPVLASAQTTARPVVPPAPQMMQMTPRVLHMPPQDRDDALRELQTIIDARPSVDMSVAELRYLTRLSQWAVSQRNRIRYMQLARPANATISIREWQDRMNAIGDDAQLANVDMQNILQHQQQTLQMMSNVSKMLYDTAQSVIRKMGG